jgi:hypothetical protein
MRGDLRDAAIDDDHAPITLDTVADQEPGAIDDNGHQLESYAMKRDRDRSRKVMSIIGLLIIAAVVISMIASAVVSVPR